MAKEKKTGKTKQKKASEQVVNDPQLLPAVPEPLPYTEERPVWNNSVRYIALVGLILIFLVLAFLLRGSLTLIVLAALVAYILNPIVRFLNKKLRIRRGLSIAIAYVLLFIIAAVAISNFIPLITQAVRNFFAIDWPEVLSGLEGLIESIESRLDEAVIHIGGFNLDLSRPLESLQEQIHSFRGESINIERFLPDLRSTAMGIYSFSTGLFGQVFAGMIMTVTAIMASMYFCRDGNQFGGFVVSMFEEKYQPEVRELMHRMRVVWDSYFVGEIKLMFFIGLITFAAYTLLGVRWAFLLGLIAGFCEVVPNIGPILATVPAMISALIFGSQWLPFNNLVIMILVIIVSVVIQQVENIFLVPHIMGNALELHPVIIIIGIMTLSSRLGLIGALFAAPLIALGKEVLYFIIKKIKRMDPYPELYS